MKHLTFALALAGPLLAASQGFAGGLAEAAPEPVISAPQPVYAAAPAANWTGFYIGGQLGYANVNASPAAQDGDGFLGGLHAGYRYDLGRAVIGAEVDHEFASIDLGRTGQLDNVTRLKGSVGADLGRMLVYGTGGAVFADASLAGSSRSDVGWFAGIGVEYAVTERILVGGEVLTNQFGGFDKSGIDLNATTAMARVSFKF